MALRAGGEIDAVCTKCKMKLAHTILAMDGVKPARVQCNTCHGQHNFRAGDMPGGAPVKAVRKPAATDSARPSRVVVSFDDTLVTKKGPPKPYSPKAKFNPDEVVDHPTFGRGWVEAVRGDKVDVTFRSGVKTLVHGKA